MRRVISVFLFVLGAWILSSAVMMAWMDLAESFSMHLAAVAFACAFAAPFLLLAMWASPGTRLRELGLTLLISAGIGGTFGLVMMLIVNDPSFLEFAPNSQELSALRFSPVFGACVVLVLGGVGRLLYRRPVSDEAAVGVEP